MVNPNKVGLVIGALIGGLAFRWSLLVVIGWAQPILHFIFWAHMIKPVSFVKPFDLVAAVTFIVITAVSGYMFGSPLFNVYRAGCRRTFHTNDRFP